MFSRQTDASKIALAHLVRFLSSHDFGVIDCQMNTPHLASLGAREIPRARFAALLGRLTGQPGVPGRWTTDHWATEKCPTDTLPLREAS